MLGSRHVRMFELSRQAAVRRWCEGERTSDRGILGGDDVSPKASMPTSLRLELREIETRVVVASLADPPCLDRPQSGRRV